MSSFTPQEDLLVFEHDASQITCELCGKKEGTGIMVSIGAKRGGTWEQCSQKLFEQAEIFWKIIKISINYKYI